MSVCVREMRLGGGWGDFPGSPVAKIFCFQCREPGFDTLLGN